MQRKKLSIPSPRRKNPPPPLPSHQGPATVVGIGASAGGLAALRKFFGQVTDSSGLAYVVVVHLAPDYESHLSDLLQPYVSIPVQQVTQTTELNPNQVYVIPPGCNLSTIDSHLRLSDLEPERRQRAPIDYFFRTLAATYDGHAIGVILTGTGSDGTLGIKDIKGKGGLIVVQDPTEAEYDSMPQSAVATGMVDLILPVEAIPAAIMQYAQTQPQVDASGDGAIIDDDHRRLLHQIFGQLRVRTGRDFSHYKLSTTMRRIARRMQLNHIEELSAYAQKLVEHPDEVRSLADDLLITVTSFFRDAEVYQFLKQDIIPQLMENREENNSVRVWSVGCATGEEAYSLAILFLEEAARRSVAPHIQIFASDLHERSLQQAREGVYPTDIESDMSPERLRQFFEKINGGYRIRREVRDLVVFAPHNLLGDPPFSRLDLIACRNVMIYLQQVIQRYVIELFYYALQPEGYLPLGLSEKLENSELFRVIHKKHNVYQRRNVPAPELRLPVFPWGLSRSGGDLKGFQEKVTPASYGMLHHRLVERYAPPSALVTFDFQLVHISEHAGRYLLQPGGTPTMNLLQSVREELKNELRAVMQAAREEGKPITSNPVTVRFNGEERSVVLHVRPALESSEEGVALVIFDEQEQVGLNEHSPQTASPSEAGKKSIIRPLEAELQHVRQQLQTLMERYETSREEMKGANEELQSANEELRSTMEELETSKEELQSMNEELQTVNQENRQKMAELSQLSDDLHNLLMATDIATLFLDRHLRILRTTPKVGELFNVQITDRGRPISHFTHRLGYNRLLEDAQQVLDQLIPIEREIQDKAGRWHLTRVLPYRSQDQRIEGIVITFVDMTVRKQAEQALQEVQHQLELELGAMQRFQELVMRLMVCRDRHAALEEILLSAMALSGAAMGNIRLVNEARQVLEIVVHRGFPADYLAQFQNITIVNPSAYNRMLTAGETVVIEDIYTDPLYEPYRAIADSAGYRAIISIPLKSRTGEWLGILSNHFLQPHRPSDRELRMLDLYGRQAAEWIEHYRMQESLQDLNDSLELRVETRTQELREKQNRILELASRLTMAEHEERHRIAQILHDNLQQLLYSVQLKIKFIQESAQSGARDDLLKNAAKAESWVQEAVQTTRQLSLDLSPPVLQQRGLGEALRWLAGHMRELHGLEIEVVEKTTVQFSTSVKILLFQTVRELLFNVVKHANVLAATVEVCEAGDQLIIKVRDQGRGFDPESLKNHAGFGVSSANNRLSLLGGKLELHSQPGQGTVVVISVPIEGCKPSS